MGIMKPDGFSPGPLSNISMTILIPALAPVVKKMLSGLASIPPSRLFINSAMSLRTASSPELSVYEPFIGFDFYLLR